MRERLAGLIFPLFSLWTGDDLGRGEIAGLLAMFELMGELGQRMLQLLPLNDSGMDTSPYNALSVFAIDPLYISPHGLPGVAKTQLARAAARVAGRRIVPRGELLTLKAPLLESAWREFQHSAAPSERAELEQFESANAYWLPDYTLFRALKHRLRWQVWEAWPQPLRDREPAALEQARAENRDAIGMFSYWQFLAVRQWQQARAAAARSGIKLAGDLAFCPARDSAEVWVHRDWFDLERTVGAPPDGFSKNGQRWGLPMPDWERMQADNFAWWRQRARRAKSLFDLVRLDHVVGFYRTFSFALKDGDPPGSYSPAEQPRQLTQGETFIAMLREEMGPEAIIAEDLGDVPPWVRASLSQHGVPGFKVFRWEREHWGTPEESFIPPAKYPELSVALTGTHDTDMLAAWWPEFAPVDRDRMAKAFSFAPALDLAAPALSEPLLDAMLEPLYGAPSYLLLTPLQDLFGWPDRINVPGTIGPDNWSWRLPRPLPELMAQPAFRARAAKVRALAHRQGRV